MATSGNRFNQVAPHAGLTSEERTKRIEAAAMTALDQKIKAGEEAEKKKTRKTKADAGS